MSACDNIGWFADPMLSRKLIQGQIFHGPQQGAHREIGLVKSYVGKK